LEQQIGKPTDGMFSISGRLGLIEDSLPGSVRIAANMVGLKRSLTQNGEPE
jgi:hypothetical protein